MVKAAPVLAVSNDVEERLREQEERRRKWAQERPRRCLLREVCRRGAVLGLLTTKSCLQLHTLPGEVQKISKVGAGNRIGLAPERG